MNESERRALDKCKTALMQSLHVRNVALSLNAYGIISDEDCARIRAKITLTEKRQLLLKQIVDKSGAWEGLLRALDENDQIFLVEKLLAAKAIV